jgi:hypothetical protein
MTDEELLDYFEIHSRTENALFRQDQIDRLYKLAGGGALDWSAFTRLLDQVPANADSIVILIKEARTMILAREYVTRSAVERKVALSEHDHEVVSRFVCDLRLADQKFVDVDVGDGVLQLDISENDLLESGKKTQ